jgi:hypothetical protein
MITIITVNAPTINQSPAIKFVDSHFTDSLNMGGWDGF